MNAIPPVSTPPRNGRGRKPKEESRAFSLMEMLVAIALLALLGLLIVQVTSAISRATRFSNQGVDAAAQARLSLDRIGADIGNAVLRPDVDFQVSGTNTAGNSFLTFLTSLPSSVGPGVSNRHISVVSYRMDASPENGNRRCLLRAGRAIGWKDAGFMGIQTSGTSDRPVPFADTAFSPDPSDYDILAPAVIQTVIGFQLRPDNQPVLLANDDRIDASRGQIVYSPPVSETSLPDAPVVDMSRVASLIVGLVVVDPERMKLADKDAIGKLAEAFDSPPDTGELPVAHWMDATQNLSNLPATVPLPVRQSVNLYQRFFPIPLP